MSEMIFGHFKGKQDLQIIPVSCCKSAGLLPLPGDTAHLEQVRGSLTCSFPGADAYFVGMCTLLKQMTTQVSLSDATNLGKLRDTSR